MTEFFQSLGMNYEWAWFVATIAGILLIALPLMLSVAMIIYVDRKVWAAINLRRGPNVVGPFGLLQSFADGLKVFLQETIVPSAANKGIFILAPIITFTVALAAWAVVPFADGWVLADINVGLLYILAISSLSVYGVVMAGWASNSKYPFFSAMRAAAQMISYEVSIGFILICVVLWAGSFNLTAIVEAQRGQVDESREEHCDRRGRRRQRGDQHNGRQHGARGSARTRDLVGPFVQAQALFAKGVVDLPSARLAQHLVGLVDLCKRFRGLLGEVLVRMELQRAPLVSPPDLVAARIAWHPEGAVECHACKRDFRLGPTEL